MEKNELDKMYEMLNSSDNEMQNLGMAVLKAYNPELDLSKLTYYNWQSNIDAEFVRILYRQCNNSNKREALIKAAYELKCQAVKNLQYQKAAFFRDIERYCSKQEEDD